MWRRRCVSTWAAVVARWTWARRRYRATIPEAFSVASEIVTGTGRWGSSVPGPMASPGGWTVSADSDHRPTEEPQPPCRRYLRTGERPDREGARDRGVAPSMARVALDTSC